MLDDVLLEDVFGHAERFALWVEVLLLQVVAVMAVQVADGADGFGKHLKFARSSDHCLILRLTTVFLRVFDCHGLWWSEEKSMGERNG